MAARAARSGRSQNRRREKRRSTASSRSPGRFVAPSTCRNSKLTVSDSGLRDGDDAQ